MVNPVMKERTWKTVKEFVMHSPIQTVAVKKMRDSVKGRRRKRSPKGQRRKRPAQYPDCASVGIRADVSFDTLKSLARMFKMG